jgi:uncharacterized delta-60 repeat protein
MSKRLLALLTGSACSFFAATELCAQAGAPDLTFGTTGMVITDFGTFNEFNEGLSALIQPDGKILVGGYVNANGSDNIAAIRYNPNGTLDTAFGTGGVAMNDFNSGTDHGQEVLLQPDGRIIVVGYAFFGGGNTDLAVVRFLANGDVDTSFGISGKVSTNISGYNDYAFDAALQSDGKIVAAGAAETGPGGDICVVRYNTDGTLDQSFDSDGIMTADIAGDYDLAYAVAIQPDGKIVTAGYSKTGPSYDFSVARFNTNGSFDNTFGSGGRVTTPVGPHEDIGADMALQSDGKIVLAGHVWNSSLSDSDYGLVRYNTDGSLDNTFGTNGIATGPVSNTYDYLRAVAVQPDGKIVAAGQTSTPGYTDLCVLRFTANGVLDTTFNTTGFIIDDVNGEQDYVAGLALQPDRKIVIVGATVVPQDVDMVIARYLGDLDIGIVDFAAWNQSVFIYPNPVSESTVLQYTLESTEEISIRVYDAQGQLVSVLMDQQTQQAGSYQQPLQLSPALAGGMYFVELASATGTVSVRIIK